MNMNYGNVTQAASQMTRQQVYSTWKCQPRDHNVYLGVTEFRSSHGRFSRRPPTAMDTEHAKTAWPQFRIRVHVRRQESPNSNVCG